MPLILAHRGACWEVPENTLEAFELAIAEEADYVEFDVRARNGELVICHDPGPPADVPSLDEILAALTGRIGLCVEVKEEETADAVVDALEAHRARPEDLIVVSFQPGALETVARRRPRIPAFCTRTTRRRPSASGGSASKSPRRRRVSRKLRRSAWQPRSSP